MNATMIADEIRTRLRLKLDPADFADVLRLAGMAADGAGDEGYVLRDATIDAIALHMPAVREIAEHVFEVDGGEPACAACGMDLYDDAGDGA
jgi:hypothetical protein